MKVRLYRASPGGQPHLTVATLTLTDRHDDADLVPPDVAPSARYFLQSVESDDGDLRARIVAVLRRASIRISRSTASSSRGVRTRGDTFADEPYGTPAYWRAAIGRIETDLPLEFDAQDWTQMVNLMDGAVPPATDSDDAWKEDDASDVDGQDAGVYVDSSYPRREEALAAAEEAVRYRRELARTRPDAFTPALAMSLNNVAAHLSALGRREEALAAAEEAVRYRRELARTQPDAFTPALAMSLNNVANCLSALGRREEALAAAEEAVRYRRELARTRPDAFTPDLATSLNNVANRLSDLGRREEALAAAEEAVRYRRELARTRPDAFTPDLAMSLNNVANFLSALGRREEALAAAEEAVQHYRELARTRPDAFTPALAMSLNNVAAHVSALSRSTGDVRVTSDGVPDVWERTRGPFKPYSSIEPDAAGWLTYLDPDPVRAEQTYHDLHRDLTRFLEWQHDDPEAAAQEALVRGLRRVADGADTSRAGVRAYVFGFAKNLAKEGWKTRTRERPLDDAAAARRPSASRGHAQVEARLMLQNVLGQLTPGDRRIIIRYCTETDHTAHCRELGVTPGNLRVIVHRIRVEIRQRQETSRPAVAK